MYIFDEVKSHFVNGKRDEARWIDIPISELMNSFYKAGLNIVDAKTDQSRGSDIPVTQRMDGLNILACDIVDSKG